MTRYASFAASLLLVLLVVAREEVSGRRHNDVLGCHNGTTVTVDECCQLPMLADPAVVEKCKAAHPFKPRGKGKPDGGAQPGACIAECILKEMGALKGANINAVAFKQAVQPTLKKNPSVAKLIDGAIDSCSTLVEDAAFSRNKNTEAGGKPLCLASPKLFVNCVYSSLFQNCPTDLWTKKDGCTQLKDKIKQGCPYFAMRKRHGRHHRPT
uniref:OBP47-like domain-containing protein n=1 Tax=Anopheles farauti TaxID=69004 RepID=A0A182QT98_9DIPT